MEKWRKLAMELFPERADLYESQEEDLSSVLFDLHDEIVDAHRSNNTDLLRRIYAFAAWCHSEKASNPDAWSRAYTIFYEHLVEEPETYHEIPKWVAPDIFADLLREYQERLENKQLYPGDSPGTFDNLLRQYDDANGTRFSRTWHESHNDKDQPRDSRLEFGSDS